MSNIAVINKPGALIGAEEIKILKQSLWPTFTDPEVNYAVAICNQLQLNPLLRQIHFVKRNTKNGATITAQTGIDGFRLTAERTGAYAGSDEPIYEYGADKKRPEKATVTVYKMVQGTRCAFTASARWIEYYQSIGGQWDKMPHVMLSKCAEALALRKAFPAELSALRTDEEMNQADHQPNKAASVQARVAPLEPAPIETTATRIGDSPVMWPAEPVQPGPDEPQDEPSDAAEPAAAPVCTGCATTLIKSKTKPVLYCPRFKEPGVEHSKVYL
jgi:phage recombination protein Bet